jgi:hypothetical protein
MTFDGEGVGVGVAIATSLSCQGPNSRGRQTGPGKLVVMLR